MSHELAEKIEHAGHQGHGGGIGRLAGITMAILGVMLAVCAAMVGGARTELIATMVEQTNTYQKYQAQRMKHRVMVTQLAALHAQVPSRRELKKFEDELAALHPKSGKAESEDAAAFKEALEASTRSMVRIFEPRAEDELHLIAASKGYNRETEAAAKWAESYEEAVQAHTLAAEHFEWGQLAAEIGIVVASVALLLSNRKAWLLSVALGIACAGILGWTYVSTQVHVTHAQAEIAATKAEYQRLRMAGGGETEDEATIEEIEKRIHELHPELAAEPAPAGAGHHE